MTKTDESLADQIVRRSADSFPDDVDPARKENTVSLVSFVKQASRYEIQESVLKFMLVNGQFISFDRCYLPFPKTWVEFTISPELRRLMEGVNMVAIRGVAFEEIDKDTFGVRQVYLSNDPTTLESIIIDAEFEIKRDGTYPDGRLKFGICPARGPAYPPEDANNLIKAFLSILSIINQHSIIEYTDKPISKLRQKMVGKPGGRMTAKVINLKFSPEESIKILRREKREYKDRTGTVPLHAVPQHPRKLKSGKTVMVKAHKRGDAKNGIRPSVYSIDLK